MPVRGLVLLILPGTKRRQHVQESKANTGSVRQRSTLDGLWRNTPAHCHPQARGTKGGAPLTKLWHGLPGRNCIREHGDFNRPQRDWLATAVVPTRERKIILATNPKQCCGGCFVRKNGCRAKPVSVSQHRNPFVGLLHHFCKMSLSRSPHQQPLGPLVQDHSMRISCARCMCRISSAGSSRTTCARSLYEDLLCQTSVSGSLYQKPLVWGPLCKIGAWGSLVRGLCVTSARSRESTCARPPYADVL